MAVGIAIMLVFAVSTVLFGLPRLVMESGSGLGGTDVIGDGLTREAQISMIDQFAPIPTPSEASDIALRYRRFQDWQFEASFTLPLPALDSYVGRLGPRLPDSPGQEGWELYEGKRIGPHAGSVRVQRTTGRVVVYHASA